MEIAIAKFITVINNAINISRYTGTPPPDDMAPRGISGGPIYAIEDVLALAQSQNLEFWTRESRRDAAKWGLDVEAVSALVSLAVTGGRFINSSWCIQNPSGPWAACDAYTVKKIVWCDRSHKDVEQTDYVKFAISKAGKMLLSVSNHPEGA